MKKFDPNKLLHPIPQTTLERIEGSMMLLRPMGYNIYTDGHTYEFAIDLGTDVYRPLSEYMDVNELSFFVAGMYNGIMEAEKRKNV